MPRKKAMKRAKKSAKLNVPAYLVFPDKTLQELARVRPVSPADLLNIRGVGPTKARQFGGEALGVIERASQRGHT